MQQRAGFKLHACRQKRDEEISVAVRGTCTCTPLVERARDQARAREGSVLRAHLLVRLPCVGCLALPPSLPPSLPPPFPSICAVRDGWLHSWRRIGRKQRSYSPVELRFAETSTPTARQHSQRKEVSRASKRQTESGGAVGRERPTRRNSSNQAPKCIDKGRSHDARGKVKPYPYYSY